MDGIFTLFAESSSADQWGYGAIGGTIVLVIGALAAGIAKVLEVRGKNSEGVRVWEEKECEKVIKFQAAELLNHQARLKSLEDDLRLVQKENEVCIRWRTVVENWFKWAEPDLTRAEIPIPTFEVNGSKVHPALPPPPIGGK